ncbi:MAG TPA: hypothetical protein DCR55_16625 [Lentisphaeria bacterium]|nr:hypothetical protein [Lentisphaeria bacterium]
MPAGQDHVGLAAFVAAVKRYQEWTLAETPGGIWTLAVDARFAPAPSPAAGICMQPQKAGSFLAIWPLG